MKSFYDKRKTLILSIMTILLCTTFIVGITLALFTSDERDGTIGINTTTGKVRVDIVDVNQQTLVGDVLDLVPLNEDEPVLFEPGATYYTEGFKIKNIGTIPINFKAYISRDDGENMELFVEGFEFYITQDPKNLTNATKIMEFTGELKPNATSDTYYLVFRMKESADNRFQNKEYSGIGITVYAAQSNIEE